MSAIQVVNGVGDLDGEGLASLLQTSGVETAGLEYSLIAIMGPQSSGKSTLLNHVFGTSFREMDASSGRSQTTQGIWLAVSPKLKEDTTLVLDLEGTDGRERGEDDTNFERQSALFALAVADVLLINLWHHDVGREHGSGKPLLKTILQENLKLFDSGRRKTLVFVIRDRSSKTPLEALAKTLREDLDKVWSGLSKPETPSAEDARPWDLESRFNLIFTSLPNYEEKEEEFEAEATLLRSKFKRGSEDCYLPSDDPVPGSALALSVGNIWATIKDNKNLDLPAHRVMVATVRCDQSIADLCRDFEASAEVGALREEAAEGILDDYGERCWGLVEARLRSFDEMVEFFEPSVCQTKRQELNSRLQICMREATSAQLEFCRAGCLDLFRGRLGSLGADEFAVGCDVAEQEALAALDEGCARCDCSGGDGAEAEPTREVLDLRARLEAEMRSDRDARLKELRQGCMEELRRSLSKALHGPFEATLEDLPEDTWPSLRNARAKAVAEERSKVAESLGGLGLPEGEVERCADDLESHASETCAALVEGAARQAPKIAKDKFVKNFCHDTKGMPRVWGPKSDVSGANQEARAEAAGAIALLAVSRLDGGSEGSPQVVRALNALASGEDNEELSSLLASDAWPGEEDASRVLLGPVDCRKAWRKVESEVAYVVSQAVTAHEAAKRESARGPPLWTILAMAVLGWNELVSLLRNPVLLVLLVVLFVFVRAVYTRIDLGAELEKGFIPAMISISLKLTPIVVEVCQQFAWQVKDAIEKNAEAGRATAGTAAAGAGEEKATSDKKED